MPRALRMEPPRKWTYGRISHSLMRSIFGDAPTRKGALFMPYMTPATSDQPAFIIYLLDLSGSMGLPCGGRRRIDVVANALERTRRKMIARSRRGDDVRPRYAVAMLGYSNTAVDLLGGIKTIDQLETMRLPDLNPQGGTNTASAFEAAYHLLQQYLPNLHDCPAPLVCHLTDGAANPGDRSGPVAEGI